MMNLRHILGSICVLFLLVCVAECKDFSVLAHGAAADGKKDCTQAFIDTWKEACASPGPTTFLVPKGNFLVGSVEFKGPCKAEMNFVLQGTIMADPDPGKFQSGRWIVFDHITGLRVSGGGAFDGQGSVAWKKNDCSKSGKCNNLPINLRFNTVENALITNITTLNSKLMHTNIMGCKNVTLQSVHVTAPGDSLNTDGIHIGLSRDINITDSVIATGDDCVSIGPGSININVIKVTCGPGHGISVGSLGKYPNEQEVNGVTVRNCTIKGTQNGVRIKSWAKSSVSASQAGVASNFIFEDIIMDNVQNPVLIDQVYCPYVKCSQNDPSKVKISHVNFNKIRGTSATKEAIKIVCSKGVPCEDVKIGDIDLKYTGKDGPATATVSFAKPTLTGVQNPKITIS